MQHKAPLQNSTALLSPKKRVNDTKERECDMRQAISTNRKNASVLNLLLGYTLIAIALYIIYRLASFVIGQIEIPPSFLNVGLGAFVITVTLIATSVLLRLDMKPIRKSIPISHKGFRK